MKFAPFTPGVRKILPAMHKIAFAPEARDDLKELYLFINGVCGETTCFLACG